MVVTLVIHESMKSVFFFFQAEDGIRDYKVTGVQTCALPISSRESRARGEGGRAALGFHQKEFFTGKERREKQGAKSERERGSRCRHHPSGPQIGRASCRERV